MITFAVGAVELQLPNPELNDSHALGNRATVHRKMDGKLRTFKTSAKHRLTLTFRKLRDDSLVEFIKTHYNNEITYTDPLEQNWLVRFIDTEFEVSSINNHFREVTLILEGQRES